MDLICSNIQVTAQEAFKQFIISCKAKNLSKATIHGYETKCRAFVDYIAGTQLCDVNSFLIDNFIISLQNSSNAGSITIATYMRHIRAYMYYCMQLGYVRTFKIKIPRAEKKIKQTYTDEELALLLKKPNLKCVSFQQYQIWVLECYLLATGNRISTVLNITVGDVDFENSSITLRITKNRKQQIVPLSPQLAEILNEYRNVCKQT